MNIGIFAVDGTHLSGLSACPCMRVIVRGMQATSCSKDIEAQMINNKLNKKHNKNINDERIIVAFMRYSPIANRVIN